MLGPRWLEPWDLPATTESVGQIGGTQSDKLEGKRLVSNSTLYHMHIGPFSNSGLIAGRDRSSPVVVRFT